MITSIKTFFIAMLMIITVTAAKPFNIEIKMFWKRTSDAEVDLNQQGRMISEHYNQILNHPQNGISNPVWTDKRILLTPEEKKERRRISKRKYQRKKELLAKEARKDKSKMTPSLEKFMEGARNRTKRYHAKIEEIVKSGNATYAQLKIFHSRKRSKFWRDLSPTNERSYQATLKKERENRTKREYEKKSKKDLEHNEDHQVPSRKRKSSELDLNVPAAEKSLKPNKRKAKKPKFDLNLPPV